MYRGTAREQPSPLVRVRGCHERDSSLSPLIRTRDIKSAEVLIGPDGKVSLTAPVQAEKNDFVGTPVWMVRRVWIDMFFSPSLSLRP